MSLKTKERNPTARRCPGRLIPLYAILALPVAGCGGDREASSSASPAWAPDTVLAVETPAGSASGEPNLHAGADGGLYLSWIEEIPEGHSLRFSRWENGAWSSSREIARGDNWFVNWADFPSVVALEDGSLFAHWLAKTSEDTYAYGVRVSVSRDGGATWSEPVTPHRDGTDTEHGFVTMTPFEDGVGLVWLDGRETGGGGHGHGGAEGGPMTLRFARMDRDGNLSEEALLDSKVCDCCSTDLFPAGDGTLVAIYRDRSDEEVRDISFVKQENGGWTKPAPVHVDNWKIPGCPVNGPAGDLREDRGAAAWFTVDTADRGHVKTAFTTDGGRSFGVPVSVDDGNPLGRVDLVLLDDGSALVCWMEDGTEGNAEIRLRRVTPEGAEPAVTVTATRSSRKSGFPRMVRHGERVFLAWTDVSEDSRVRTAVLD